MRNYSVDLKKGLEVPGVVYRTIFRVACKYGNFDQDDRAAHRLVYVCIPMHVYLNINN